MNDLWQHQKDDIKFILKNPGVFNTSDPGTGKTRTCIEVIKALKLPTLIVCPLSIMKPAWGNDLDTFAPELEYSLAYAQGRADVFREGKSIVITNHDAVKWLDKNPKHLDRFKGGLLIIDESTAFKTPTSQRTKAIHELRPLFSRCVAMTGTPNPNGVLDLWAQMFLVDEGKRLGKSFYRFRHETCMQISRGAFNEWVEKEGVLEAVGSIISDVTIRHSRDDCMDLPPNQVITVPFELSAEHRAAYEQMRLSTLLEIDDRIINAINAASLANKLLQLASGAVYDGEHVAAVIATERYELAMDLVEARPHSVVVFNWTHQRDELIKVAEKRKLSYAVIDSSVPVKKRNTVIEDYQAGKLRTLFIQPQSAGHGLTLTRGCATIWVSPIATHNAEHYEQVNARIYRGGQTQKTETILITAKNTTERKAYFNLMSKRADMINLLEILK